VRESADDFFLYLRDYLIGNPGALAMYNRLKREHASHGAEAYWKAKDQFFGGLLTNGPRESRSTPITAARLTSP